MARTEQKLLKVVESVFAAYKDSAEKQYSVIRDSVHFHLPEPHPTGRLRFSGSNLEFVVRYPVDIRKSAEIDDQMIHRLIETIQGDPTLRVNGWSTPKAG